MLNIKIKHILTASNRALFRSTTSVLGVLRGGNFLIGLESFFDDFFRFWQCLVFVFSSSSNTLEQLSVFISKSTILLSFLPNKVVFISSLDSKKTSFMFETEHNSLLSSIGLLSCDDDSLTIAISIGGSSSLDSSYSSNSFKATGLLLSSTVLSSFLTSAFYIKINVLYIYSYR